MIPNLWRPLSLASREQLYWTMPQASALRKEENSELKAAIAGPEAMPPTREMSERRVLLREAGGWRDVELMRISV